VTTVMELVREASIALVVGVLAKSLMTMSRLTECMAAGLAIAEPPLVEAEGHS
jgi:hypothetical protein